MLLTALPVAALSHRPPAAAPGWDARLYNPQPRPDDVLVPLPCGGAIALRRILLPDPGDARAPVEDLRGPWHDAQGQPYFLLGKYEVSRAQAAAVMAWYQNLPCPAPTWPADAHPATLDWPAAEALGRHLRGWLGVVDQGRARCGDTDDGPCIPDLDGDEQIASVRLPTEAEWTYAAHGGLAVSTAASGQPCYPMPEGLEAHAWYHDNARADTHPIGTRAANPLGLHDLYGNVAEYTARTSPSDTEHGRREGYTAVGGGYQTHADELVSARPIHAGLYDAHGGRQLSDIGLRLLIGTALPAGPLLTAPDRARLQRLRHSLGLTGDGLDNATLRALLDAAERPIDGHAVRAGQPLPATAPDLPALIALPGGRFLMGSAPDEPGRSEDEGPQHLVTLAPFAIGRTEVTFAEYAPFARATGRRLPDDRGWGGNTQPVIDVTWHDASAYLDWLSARTGQRWRLPSEAEWEYAARGGTSTAFWNGPCPGAAQANYIGNAATAAALPDCRVPPMERRRPVPAGSLPGNPFGLHEVAGNAYEWVQDCWHADYCGAPADGRPWEHARCTLRMLRGGAFDYGPAHARSAARNASRADQRYLSVGFRAARELPVAGNNRAPVDHR